MEPSLSVAIAAVSSIGVSCAMSESSGEIGGIVREAEKETKFGLINNPVGKTAPRSGQNLSMMTVG